MKGKVKSVLVVFFAATILTIGTGIVMAQTYKIPVSSYLALDLTVVLNQNRVPADNPQGTTDSKLLTPQNTIDSDLLLNLTQALNLTQTKTTKESVQNQINKGFQTWMSKSLQRLLSSFNADNETIRSLFFQFLSENPKYRELFKQYDQLLSDEVGVITLKIANETYGNINLIMSKGEVVRQWNVTNTVNENTYTYVYSDYALDINGTTQHFLKVSVYTSDGTLIIDPNLMIFATPLYYWVWWFGWYPILYGYDFGCWVHYTPEETPLYLNNAFIVLVSQAGSSTWADIGLVISAVGLIASLLTLNPAGIVASATGLIVSIAGKLQSEYCAWAWNIISSAAAINAMGDPNYGFQLFQRFHYVVSGPFWDPLSWTSFHIILYNGAVQQVCPYVGVSYITDSATLSVYVSFMWWYNANVGFYRWVWVGYG